MAIVFCPCCRREAERGSLFCRRCGSDLRPIDEADLLLRRLELVRQLIAHRVWHALDGELESVGAAISRRPELYLSTRHSFTWLEHDVIAMGRRSLDVTRFLHVTKRLLNALPSDLMESLRAERSRLLEFVAGLVLTDTQLRTQKRPSPELQAWLRVFAHKHGVQLARAIDMVYETPEYWPWLAAGLDPVTYRGGTEGRLVVAQGRNLLRQRRWEEARQQFAQALAKDPSDVRALEGLAKAFASLGRAQEAVKCYRAAVNKGTQDALTWQSLAWLLLNDPKATEDDLIEAARLSRRAVELAPVDSFWTTLAQAHLRLYELPSALAAVREALRLSPDDPGHRDLMKRLIELTSRGAAPTRREQDELAQSVGMLDPIRILESLDNPAEAQGLQKMLADFDFAKFDAGLPPSGSNDEFKLSEEDVSETTRIPPRKGAPKPRDESFPQDWALNSESQNVGRLESSNERSQP